MRLASARPVQPQPSPQRVTELLRAQAAGAGSAADELLPLVYDELRALAQRRMAAEPAGATIQATALVHEAYLRGHRRSKRTTRWDPMPPGGVGNPRQAFGGGLMGAWRRRRG